MTPHHPSDSPSRQRAPGRRAAAALIAAATTCAAPSWAGPKNVPFKAAVVTQETLRVDAAACPAAPFLAGSTTGTGVASQLGVISFVASDCITPSATTFTFSNGQLTITAANGDELKGTYSGTLTPLVNALQLPLYTVSGSYTITGGTGRLAGATGSGSLQGLENTLTGQGYFNLNGTISY